MEYIRRRFTRGPEQSSSNDANAESSEEEDFAEIIPPKPLIEENAAADEDEQQDFVPIHFLENRIRTLSRTSVPHDLNRLTQHKENMILFNTEQDWEKLHAEQVNASRTVQHLKGHLQTIEDLRQQVQPSDLLSFNRATNSLREDILSAVQDYQAVTVSMETERGMSQEDMQDEGSQLLAQKEANHYQSLEDLRKDLLELNTLVEQLNIATKQHSHLVSNVNAKTESASAQIQGGVSNIGRAEKLKTYMLPVGGAIVGGVLGGVVGGPVGAFAGLKVGAVTAAAAGTAGVVGGALIGYRVRHSNNAATTTSATASATTGAGAAAAAGVEASSTSVADPVLKKSN